MNISNFGYDCRNDFDNYKFVPIFDEYNELSYIHSYHNIFDQRVSQFNHSIFKRKNVDVS